MRVSLALLPLLGAAYAIPIQQQPPTDPARAELLDLGDILGGGLDLGNLLGGIDLGSLLGGGGLPDLGGIFGGHLPHLEVSEIIAQLNSTLGGALPPIPAEILAKIQDLLDQISGGAKFNNNFKAADFGPFEGLELPSWLLDLVQKLIEFLTGLSNGGGLPPISLPTNIPTDLPFPTGLPTDAPIPTGLPTDAPIPVPTDLPTDAPIPVPTDLPTEPAPTGVPTDLPTDDPLPVPTDLPTDPAPTILPTDAPIPRPTGSTNVPLPTKPGQEEPLPTDTPLPGEEESTSSDEPTATDSGETLPTDAPEAPELPGQVPQIPGEDDTEISIPEGEIPEEDLPSPGPGRQ